MTINNQELYNSLIEDDFDLSTFKTSLGSDQKEVTQFLKYQDSNTGATALHVAFELGHKDLIEYLLGLTLTSWSDILNIQDDSGNLAITSVLENEGASEILTSIKNVTCIRELFLAKGFEGNTFVHSFNDKSNLLEAILNIAKEKEFIKDFLSQENNFGASFLHRATELEKEGFVSVILKSSGSIEGIISADSETKPIDAAFESDNANIILNFLEYADTNILESVDASGMRRIETLFNNEKFQEVFSASKQKETILDSIVANVLSATTLGSVNEGDKTALKDKITALYNAIEGIQGDDTLKGTLKAKFLEAVNLDATEYQVTDFFSDGIIKSKLEAVDGGIVTTVTALSGEGITVQALKESALDEIAKLTEKFYDKLPANFGNSTKAAVTTKLDEVVNTQKTAIDATTDLGGLETAYTNAKTAIEAYQDVYKALDNDSTNTECAAIISCQQAIEFLNQPVITKAGEIVDVVCTGSYTEVQAATNCKTLIESFRDSSLPIADKENFAKNQFMVAEQFIKKNSFDSANLSKLAVLVYSYKYDMVMKDKMGVFVTLGEDDKVSQAPSLKKMFKQIDTKLLSSNEYQPGFAAMKSASSTSLYGVNFAQFYKMMSQAQNLKKYGESFDIYKKNFSNDESKINSNMQKSLGKACEFAHKEEEQCTFESILAFTKEEIDKLPEGDSVKTDSISQCILQESFDNMDADALYTTCIESSADM